MSFLPFLLTGTLLGLSSGISPGPLLILVISETLVHGARAGIKVALAPLLSDIPLVLISIFILSRITHLHTIVGGIYVVGAIYLSYLSYESITFSGKIFSVPDTHSQSLKKGVIANVLNPSPYLFWMSIGATTFTKGMDISILAAASFIASFYLFLIGSKIVIAVLVAKSKSLLKNKYYVYIIRSLGLLLLLIAVIFVAEAFKHLER